MKKIIAITLGILMLLCVLPVSSFAATEYNTSGSFIFSDSLNATITEGTVMTIPDGVDMVVNNGETFIIEKGATLIVLGTLEVAKGGTMEIRGTLVHSERVTAIGAANVYFYFDNTSAASYKGLGGKLNSVYAGYSKTGSVYADLISAGSDDVVWSENLMYGGTFSAPLNSYIYVKPSFRQPVIIPDNNPKSYDDEKLGVYFDGMKAESKQGVRILKVETSAAVSYDKWSDTAFLYGYKFEVPKGAGYIVHGEKGESSQLGAIYIPAGSDFRFRVEINGDYDMSEYDVYCCKGYVYDNKSFEDKIADGEAAKLTAVDGFYTISAPLDSGVKGVYSDYTIFVMGVVSNDTIKTASSILDILRNAINVIRTFFERLFSMLGISIAA